jgi:ATP/maltotriose-dependent transcriptional regulator MalT
VDRFCADLCDVLGGVDAKPSEGEIDGAAFIAKLQKDNLFLVALDTENRWFRYHHFFHQLLQDQLNQGWRPEEIAALQSRANAWFAENDITDDAKNHTLAAFSDDEHRTLPDANSLLIPPSLRGVGPHHPLSPSPSHPSPQPLVDPLTNRELDILELLSQRLSNKEISAKLFISPNTVKKHLDNMYGKLNVGSRRQAVEKAKKIGILSGDK